MPHRLCHIRRIHNKVGVVCGRCRRCLAIQIRHRRPRPLCGARAESYRRIERIVSECQFIPGRSRGGLVPRLLEESVRIHGIFRTRSESERWIRKYAGRRRAACSSYRVLRPYISRKSKKAKKNAEEVHGVLFRLWVFLVRSAFREPLGR